MLQLGKNFSVKKIDNLVNYLPSLPKDIPVFVEARHITWFEGEGRKNLFDTLHTLNLGSIISDVAGRRDCVHMELTTPHAMIRFVGNDLHPTDYSRVDAWVQRIKTWKEMGLQSLWFFVHEADENNSPAMAEYLITKLNQEIGINIQPPKLIKQNNLLF